MPPIGRHYGLPGAQAVPDGWAAAHAPVVTTTYDCTVTIGPAGGAPAWNPATKQTETPALTPVYDGPASVGLVSTSDGTRAEAGEDQADERAYEVKIPADVDAYVAPEHVVLVTDSPNSALVGARLRVTSVATPGREFSRVIHTTLTT